MFNMFTYNFAILTLFITSFCCNMHSLELKRRLFVKLFFVGDNEADVERDVLDVTGRFVEDSATPK